ncbi:helix-turn-helix transcriptional regulator [Streptomyces sp. SL54]|uniref:Helix-turn-helix transcriptional regulator n=2 Tax=Streptantibioticus silvisoli TaxID=2705255 RepID=A0ABT6W7W9_9ACTN|nr:helix-turn-helix transcriptional regulator [Streptantibioticus silvisoli]MDI5966848.1 helix-turn-helix transcriptional regulator [Streptantibioticus silvisoli]
MPARSRELRPDRSARDLFGAEMRRYREQECMSLERLGGIVGFSKSVLSRVETADAMMAPDLPSKLDATFHTEGLFEKLYALAKNEIHPDRYRRRMELERRAVAIEVLAGHIVPGLVQTEGYARELFRIGNPSAKPDEIEHKVDVREGRKDIFERDPQPFLGMILDEAVLRRPIGGPDVMRAQLASLLELVDAPNSLVQVMPFNHGGHALMGGTLNLLTLDDGTAVAYEESIGSGTLFEDKESVTTRRRAYDRLRAYALSPCETGALIQDVMEALPR